MGSMKLLCILSHTLCYVKVKQRGGFPPHPLCCTTPRKVIYFAHTEHIFKGLLNSVAHATLTLKGSVFIWTFLMLTLNISASNQNKMNMMSLIVSSSIMCFLKHCVTSHMIFILLNLYVNTRSACASKLCLCSCL